MNEIALVSCNKGVLIFDGKIKQKVVLFFFPSFCPV